MRFTIEIPNARPVVGKLFPVAAVDRWWNPVRLEWTDAHSASSRRRASSHIYDSGLTDAGQGERQCERLSRRCGVLPASLRSDVGLCWQTRSCSLKQRSRAMDAAEAHSSRWQRQRFNNVRSAASSQCTSSRRVFDWIT